MGSSLHSYLINDNWHVTWPRSSNFHIKRHQMLLSGTNWYSVETNCYSVGTNCGVQLLNNACTVHTMVQTNQSRVLCHMTCPSQSFFIFLVTMQMKMILDSKKKHEIEKKVTAMYLWSSSRSPYFKSERRREKRKKEKRRLNDGDNNGQATHGARKPPGPIFFFCCFRKFLLLSSGFYQLIYVFSQLLIRFTCIEVDDILLSFMNLIDGLKSRKLMKVNIEYN